MHYTSLNRFYGDDRVLYIAIDSRGKESNLATVNIRFTNRAPLAQDNTIGVASGATVSQYLLGTDDDGDAVTFQLVNNPRYGRGEVKLDPQGKWRFYYTSLPGYVGPDQITFIAIDPMGRESQVAKISINVVARERRPGAFGWQFVSRQIKRPKGANLLIRSLWAFGRRLVRSEVDNFGQRADLDVNFRPARLRRAASGARVSIIVRRCRETRR